MSARPSCCSPPTDRDPPRSLPFLILLAAVVGLGGLAIDMYLPALPTIGAEFAAASDRVQLTMGVYLLGGAVGQIVIGPLSDRFGRRPMLIRNFLVFALASLGAMSTDPVEALIARRLLLSLGSSVGGVGRPGCCTATARCCGIAATSPMCSASPLPSPGCSPPSPGPPMP